MGEDDDADNPNRRRGGGRRRATRRLTDDGCIVVTRAQPPSITVKAGETVEFVNNKAFPHNVVFDEDNVPAGVNADAISHEDYLNGPGEKVTNKFDKAGTYGYYCEPHQGAGMQGTIIVQ